MSGQGWPLKGLGLHVQLTSRVAEPAVLARHLRFSANGVTAQGLGGRSAATGAGNSVLAEVGVLSGESHNINSTFLS